MRLISALVLARLCIAGPAVLLAPYSLLKNADAVQVRFNSGDTYKSPAVQPGEAVFTVTHTEALAWFAKAPAPLRHDFGGRVQSKQVANPDAPDKSEALNRVKERDEILRTFKTMYVDAGGARFFKSDQLKAALGRNKGFNALNIRIVNDPKLADTILEVGYTFAWDYPFELKHQNTTTVLLAGKGNGPFSGPAGAASVANEFVKAAKPYRTAAKTTN